MYFLAPLFFIARLIFYSTFSQDQLTFGNPDNLIRQIDLMFISTGLFMALTLPHKGTTFTRLKVLFLTAPFIFVFPMIYLAYSVHTNSDINTDNWLFVADLFFLLYTVIFAFILGLDIPRSGRSQVEIKVFLLIIFALTILMLNLEPNSKFTNLLHTIPFLWTSIRFVPNPKS